MNNKELIGRALLAQMGLRGDDRVSTNVRNVIGELVQALKKLSWISVTDKLPIDLGLHDPDQLEIDAYSETYRCAYVACYYSKGLFWERLTDIDGDFDCYQEVTNVSYWREQRRDIPKEET